LKKHPEIKVRVFVVWEPILQTDWSPPFSGVLGRVSDSRVTQFWDKEHYMASRLAKDARDPQPTQKCCIRNGYLWDLAVVYSPGVQWGNQLPVATMFDGPVEPVRARIVQALTASK
jgi:hypothetical protein